MGHSLSYRFECYMEFGNASNEGAPPAPPRNKDLSRNLRMQIVAMLQGMENDGSLRRGSITAITKRFGVAHCTVHCLWITRFQFPKKFREATYLSYGVCL